MVAHVLTNLSEITVLGMYNYPFVKYTQPLMSFSVFLQMLFNPIYCRLPMHIQTGGQAPSERVCVQHWLMFIKEGGHWGWQWQL